MLKKLPPHHLVCQGRGGKLSVKELIWKSERMATFLQGQGIKRGDKVLMAVAPGPEFLVVFLALIHLRALTALVDPHMGNALYEAKLRQFNPHFAFIDSRILLLQEHPWLRWAYQKLKTGGFYIPFSKSYHTFATGPWLPLFQKHNRLKWPDAVVPQFEKARMKEEIFITYTSGTLSDPKAVVHTFKSLFKSIEALGTLLGKTEDQVLATHLPHFALIGLFTGFKTLFWNGQWQAEKKIKFMARHNVSTLFGPPAEYRPLIEYCKAQGEKLPHGLKHLIFGSAPVPRSFLKEIRLLTEARLTCFYGMTENLLIASAEGEEKLQNHKKGDLLGKPFEGVEVKVNEGEELLIKGSFLFSHYFGSEKQEDWFATGDLVRLDEEGNLYMMGRKKNMIIRAHKNIYPGLYEPTIIEIDGIKEALLIGLYDEGIYDEKVVLVADAAESMSKDSLGKSLASGPHAIDSDVLPDHIVFMKIPRKGRQQKVDYQTLEKKVRSQLNMTL